MQSPLFYGITADALEAVIHCLQPKVYTYSKGSYVTVEGERFTGLGILLTGKASVIKENAAGNRIVMSLLTPGDMFGEMFVFSTSKIWPLSVISQDECQVMFWPSIKIIGTCSKVCANHKQIISNMLTIVSEKAITLNRKVEYLAIKGMREKISTYLLEQYKLTASQTFTIMLNRNDLADFLNVSRTALSREMGRMRDEGLIEYYRSSIKIKNLDALTKVVE
ncbi:Crp/Fnr family transcriptional regulator [Sporomusa acidovorans]|uniref:cAMP receptor protein n=2 Tax=Sporomusa TaxID=2375 RepID=A0ABZ3J337_SPOA4|nr:Crp/Fnr family transcriptional regulator [Sporomusa acidovorans]OZC19978.1 cAMP receptor protein [Sporomusa acidovorans DSM 3132]SDD48580.1 cAMP-binding domain of CRP or a regulatory subunit of cAMP-dependent protein kinases [Sporomusa acidovorans]